jgi:hypothetical protein
MDKKIAELIKKGYTKPQAFMIVKQQGGTTNGYSNNQKPIARILRNVETNEVKEGSLQPGFYTKVEYQDGSIDYIKPENEDMLYRMPNYIEYSKNKAKKSDFIIQENSLVRAQQGYTWDKDGNQVPDLVQGTPLPKEYEYLMGDYNLDGGVNSKDQVDKFGNLVKTNTPNQYANNRVNLISPDGGLSLDFALNYAGRGFGAKNPWQAGMGTGLSLLKGARNFLTGYGEGKENLRVAEEMQDYQFDRPRNYVYGQSGGKIKNSDVLAQNAIVDEGQGNINMEGDEFVLRNNGQVQPVVGEPHVKNGKIADGVNATLNDGDKVISDYVKLKPADIKDLKERYDVSLKRGATFAQAQKKIDQKLGIKKLEDEKATILEKLEKAANIKDKNSQELSQNALLKSYGTINEKLGTLQGIRSEAADFIFERQERQPKKGDGTQIFDKNGKEVAQEGKEVYQQGGDFYISQLAKKHNIPLERAMELVKMQMGGEQEQGGQQEQVMQMVAEALQSGVSPEEILSQLLEMGVSKEEGAQLIQGVMQQMQAPQEQQVAQSGVEYSEEERATRLDDYFRNIKNLGYEGEKQIGKMQDWVAENYPEQVTSYFLESGQPLTAKHIDLMKEKYKTTFEKVGISSDKPSAKYTEEEKKKLQEELFSVMDSIEDSKGVKKDFLLEGFKDNKWDWRFPMVKGKMTADVKPVQNNAQIQAGLIPQEPNTTPLKGEPTLPQPTGAVAPQPRSGVKNIMSNFEPYIPLFGSIQPIAKQTADFNRLEPIKATVEPMLAEQERMRATETERIEQLGLSPQQQEALLASGLATSQNSANDAISKVEQWNAQNQFATDQYNAGASTKEQIMNNQYSADYQDKMMATLANLEESTRNQYRTQFLQGQSDRNYVTNLNKINTLSDQFAVTPNGVEYLNNTGMPVQDNKVLNKQLEEMTPEEREAYKKYMNFVEAKKRNS